jgi:hypothetical protein
MFGWFRKKPAPLSPAATRAPGEFQGSPWNAEPTEDWNRPAYWQNYYRELLADPAPWRRRLVVHREVDLLIRMLLQAGELPRSSPQPLLDAGCGIALVPYVLAFWGFQVTAIDSCLQAIQLASSHRPTEEELAACVPIWDPSPDMPNAYQLVEDPARSLKRLREFKAPGGSVSYLAGDWLSAELPPGGFGVVHCRNRRRSLPPKLDYLQVWDTPRPCNASVSCKEATTRARELFCLQENQTGPPT